MAQSPPEPQSAPLPGGDAPASPSPTPDASAPLPRCPVCGEPPGEEPMICPHCETPHHPDCWAYVPGCAVFGCSEQTALALRTENWPVVHRAVVEGVDSVRSSARGLQAMLVSFALVLGSIEAPGVPFLLSGLAFLGSMLWTLWSMNRAFTVKHQLRREGALETLQELQSQGDRHLAQAVAERTGRALPVPPSLAALGLSGLAVLPMVLVRGTTLPTGDSVGFLVALLAVIFYVGLKLTDRWAGYQQIWRNRLESAVVEALPRKAGTD